MVGLGSIGLILLLFLLGWGSNIDYFTNRSTDHGTHACTAMSMILCFRCSQYIIGPRGCQSLRGAFLFGKSYPPLRFLGGSFKEAARASSPPYRRCPSGAPPQQAAWSCISSASNSCSLSISYSSYPYPTPLTNANLTTLNRNLVA